MKMATSLSRIFAAPVEQKAVIKQGIVAILNSDGGGRSEGSIRRTLSADMSSKKWLEQNGMMKKVVSSQELMKLPVSVSDSSDEDEDEDEEEEGEKQKPAALEDVWSSIMMSKKENDPVPPAAYVHPLVKRSSSALNEKSLKICTESLGSETGSDCFSVDESKDGENRVLQEELKEELKEVEDQFRDFFPKYRKSPATPSPPPLPPPIRSISGSLIHMNSRRENGRLVVEAVSVPPRNFFQAQRCGGRLVLSLIGTPPSAEESDGAAEFEETTDTEILEGGDGDDGDGEEEETFQIEQSLNSPQKSGVMMKQFIGFGNRNLKTDKTTIASAADVAEEEEDKTFTAAHSLPPPPPPRVPRLIPRPPTQTTAAADAASFDSYDYARRNMTAVSGGGFLNKRRLNDVKTDGVKGNVNKAEYFGPYLRGCKEGPRSLLIGEPYCIAT